MAEILITKTGPNTLSGMDTEAEEIIQKLPYGKAVRMKYSFPRNVGNHRRFFAFLKVTFDIQDHFDNINHYRKWVIMKSGHYKIIVAPNGYQIFDADSIAFDKMDEAAFNKLFNDCIDVFVGEWGHRISRDELLRVVDFS